MSTHSGRPKLHRQIVRTVSASLGHRQMLQCCLEPIRPRVVDREIQGCDFQRQGCHGNQEYLHDNCNLLLFKSSFHSEVDSLEIDNDDILFCCKMLAIVVPDLSTSTGITPAIDIDDYCFAWRATRRHPDVEVEAVFAKGVGCLEKIFETCKALSSQVCQVCVVCIQVIASCCKW